MIKIKKRIKEFLKRPCKKCESVFCPTSKFSYMCDNCLKSRYNNAGVKNTNKK